MATFVINAEHTSGQSVGHPCTKGVYSDPSDSLCGCTVEAASEEQAERLAWEKLRELVEAAKPCDCHRKLEPGFNRWWDSVTVSVEAEQ